MPCTSAAQAPNSAIVGSAIILPKRSHGAASVECFERDDDEIARRRFLKERALVNSGGLSGGIKRCFHRPSRSPETPCQFLLFGRLLQLVGKYE
jgi:hypothetical protein